MPDDVKKQVDSLQKRLKTGCRFVDAHPQWVSVENLHITLVFLGAVEERYIPALIDTSESVAKQWGAFDLELNRTDLFPPNSKQPRVISMGVGGEKRTLSRLQYQLAERLYYSGYDVDDRSYKPHITLARLPSAKTASRVQSVVGAHTNALQAKFRVEEIVLYESVSGEDGPSYVPIHRAQLGQESPSE